MIRDMITYEALLRRNAGEENSRPSLVQSRVEFKEIVEATLDVELSFRVFATSLILDVAA